MRLSRKCTDNYNIRYALRQNLNRLPLWRTFERTPRHGEMFYYQLVILNYPCRNFDDAVGDSTYREFFNDHVEELNLDPDYLARIREQERAVEVERMTNEQTNDQSENLELMLERANLEQLSIYNDLVNSSNYGIYAVVGGGGSGKSFLLRLLNLGIKQKGFTVVKLAPTGVPAQSINGETIHRFFGMNNANLITNEIRIDDFVRLKVESFFLLMSFQ